MLSEIDKTRLAYLLIMCERSEGMIHRNYVEEKATRIFLCREVWEIRSMLDENGQRMFDIKMEK